MKILHLIVRGRIPSKKNNRLSAGRFTIPNNRYREWHESAGLQLLKHHGLNLENVELQLEFYMPDNRKTDLDNKVTSVFDVLKDMNIIKDDCWQILPKFSVESKGIEKINPRVEIWIKAYGKKKA